MLPLRRYERISTKNRWFRSNGGRLPKISGRRGRPQQPFFSQTRLSELSYGIKIWTDLFLCCDNAYVWQTDRRTNSFLLTRPPCKNGKKTTEVSQGRHSRPVRQPGRKAWPPSRPPTAPLMTFFWYFYSLCNNVTHSPRLLWCFPAGKAKHRTALIL